MEFNWKTIWHEKQKKQIESDIINNNLSHAYLFSGPVGIGKFEFAKEIAQVLMCENNWCKTCSNCRQIDNLSHSDFLILDMLFIDEQNTDFDIISKYSNVNQSHRSSTPKAKTNKIDIKLIKNIQEKINEKKISKYKICIIKNIDRITTEAANAFLKSIEEPPENTIFIFTTAKESLLLPTIISRLRIIAFNLIHNDLISNEIWDCENKEEILNYAQWRLKVAKKLSKDIEFLIDMREQYKKIHEVYQNYTLAKQFAFVSEISDNVVKINEFIESSYFYLHSKINSQSINVIKIIEELEKTEILIKKNINKKLALDNFFISISN